MTLEEPSTVIYLPIHNKPRLLRAAICFELCQINLTTDAFLLHIDLLHRLRLNRRLALNPLTPITIQQVSTGLFILLHPTTSLGRVRGMLKFQTVPLFGDGNPEPGVVHHSQNRPVHIPWLGR